MVNINIERNKNEEDDFIDLGLSRPKKDIGWKFLELRSKLERKYLHDEKKPWCGRCFKFDFEDEKDKRGLEAQRGGISDVKRDDDLLKEFLKKASKYSESDRFSILSETKANEHVKQGNRSVIEEVGVHRQYQCKKRGCGLSLFVSTQ